MSLEQIAFDRLNQKCDASYTDLSYLEEYGKIVALYKTSLERKKTEDRSINYEVDDILKTLDDNAIYFIAKERIKIKSDKSYTDLSYLEEYGKIVALYKTSLERKKTGTRDVAYDVNQIIMGLNSSSIASLTSDRIKQKADPSYTDLSYMEEYLKVYELYNLEIENIRKRCSTTDEKAHNTFIK